MLKKQYPFIDIAKFICAFIILFYHCFSEHGPVFWVLEESLSLYAVAVALFMTLSGFLLFQRLETATDGVERWKTVKAQVSRILTIYLLWSIPYVIFNVYTWEKTSVDLIYVLTQVRNWIFNSTFYTIWFMPSLAVGILFTYFLNQHMTWKWVCVTAVLFYILGSLQTTYSFVVESIPAFHLFAKFSSVWLQGARGGIFFGMPLVVLGGTVSRLRWKSPKTWAAMSVFFMGLLLGEALVLRYFVGGCGLDLAISMIPLCFSIAMFLTSVTWNMDGKYKWMRSMSVLIFMAQRLFLTVIPWFFPESLKMSVFGNPYIGAFFVCCGTVVFSAAIIHGSKRVSLLKLLY